MIACAWCDGSKQRLDTKTMKWGPCLKHPTKHKVEKEEVVDLVKKYADRIRVGKTAKDKSRRRHKEDSVG